LEEATSQYFWVVAGPNIESPAGVVGDRSELLQVIEQISTDDMLLKKLWGFE
jgi:hypothetical protein